MTISITWDGAPIRQSFGKCNIVADGVAELANGKRYRINASASRYFRDPEIVLRNLPGGRYVPDNQLATIRAAALEAFTAILAPMRAEFVARARAADEAYMAEQRDARNAAQRRAADAIVTMVRDAIPNYVHSLQQPHESADSWQARMADHRRTGIPLWSGRGDAPVIGSTVRDRNGVAIKITGYRVAGGWLMALGHRTANPDISGDISGLEIDWPEFEVHAIDSPKVRNVIAAWLDTYGRLPDGKTHAVVRYASSDGRMMLWSYHASERAARQSIARAAAKRPVR